MQMKTTTLLLLSQLSDSIWPKRRTPHNGKEFTINRSSSLTLRFLFGDLSVFAWWPLLSNSLFPFCLFRFSFWVLISLIWKLTCNILDLIWPILPKKWVTEKQATAGSVWGSCTVRCMKNSASLARSVSYALGCGVWAKENKEQQLTGRAVGNRATRTPESRENLS